MLAKPFQRLVLGIICLLLVGANLFAFVGATPEISPWLAAAPELAKVGDIDVAELTQDMTNNRDCQPREILTRPGRILPIPQTKRTRDACVTDTIYGALSTDGFLQRQGSNVFGQLLNSIGATAQTMPIPHSSTGILMSGGTGYGYYLFFVDSLEHSLSSSVIYNGEVTHKLPPYTSGRLSDRSGHLLAANHDSISFSTTGEWMVVDVPFIGAIRVNTVTRDVLPFGDAINYGIGLGAGYRSAISPDGRYAAVASSNFGLFRIYDLSTCGPVPNTITTKVPCTYKDLQPLARQKISDFSAITSIRFRGAHSLDIYVATNTPARPTKYSRHLLTAAGQQAPGFQYLALGDSFASGEGAFQYKSITDTNQNKCHLSQRSYPYLISAELGFSQYESVACSGAKLEDFTSIYDDYEGQVKDGKKRIERDINGLLTGMVPGYLAQLEFIKKHNPGIITLSAVGNDIGFGDKIKRCLDTDTCYSSYEDRLEIVQEIKSQFYRLTETYKELQKAGGSHMRIYVIGYPQIVDPNGDCALNVHLNHDERLFAQNLISYLNGMIKTAAANQGAYYVDVEDAFAGHKLCETTSWNVAVNGLTSGNDILNIPLVRGPIGNESFHPTAFGHELLKMTILDKTTNLTAPMPKPDPSQKISDPSDDLPLLNAPKSNRVVNTIKNIAGTNGGVIETGKTWFLRTPPGLGLQALSKVNGVIRSNPYYLGEFTVSSDGTIPVEFTLPNSFPAGFHTVHLYGTNYSGEGIDLYMTVFVANGVVSACGVVPISGQDSDQDNVDDACDPFIDQPPLPESPIEVKVSTSANLPPAEVLHSIEPNAPLQAPTNTNQDDSTTQTRLTNVLAESTPIATPQVAAAKTIAPSTTAVSLSSKNDHIKEKFNNFLLFFFATVPLCFLLIRHYY